eukprot:4061678-Pyramimonas_sp.AAC.1
MSWFVRAAWSYCSYVVTTVRGFAQGSRSGHDTRVALEGGPDAALARKGPAETMVVDEHYVNYNNWARGGGADNMKPKDFIIRS